MKPARILLVEDELDVLEANRVYLEQLGYHVSCASSLAQARMRVSEQLPDLVLLDIMLPDGSGLAFCAELREQTMAPIIFLTCLDSNADIIAGIEQGGDDYIAKPYDLTVLAARVKAQLRRNGFGAAAQVELSPLLVDLSKNTADLYQLHVQLTPKEAQLLAFLASNAGREFSKAQIYEQVWGRASTGSLDTVKMHISTLRKKLHLDIGSPIEIAATSRGNYVLTRTVFGAAARS